MNPTDILTIAQYAHKKRPDLFGESFIDNHYNPPICKICVEILDDRGELLERVWEPFNPLTNDTDFRMLLEAFAEDVCEHVSMETDDPDLCGFDVAYDFWSTITKESFCNKLLEMLEAKYEPVSM